MTLTKDLEYLYTITGKRWWVVTNHKGLVTMFEQDGISVIRYTLTNHPIVNKFNNKKVVNRRQ